MPKKRVFISSRIEEMRAFRKMANIAIRQAGMEPVFFDSSDPENKRLKMGIPLFHQLIEAVKSSDAFLGIYGKTLYTNWIPPGETKHMMEFEYETARSKGLPCFCYVTQSDENSDADMKRFRRQVMEIGVEFLTTPVALKKHLLNQLMQLNPRIFISYSSKDNDFVKRLHKKLKQSGQHVWLNTESIPKGERWYDEMTCLRINLT